MARLFPLLRIRLIMATIFVGVTAFASFAAQAADMRPYSPVEPPPVEEPVEWGSGWYLRGDIGWQNVQLPAVTGEFATMKGVDNIVSGGLGGGYQFNDWLRADVTVDRSVFRMNRPLDTVWCPYQAMGLFTQDASGTDVPVGIFANPSDTCTPQSKGTLNRTSFLLNGYLDLGHYWGFTPYVGAGLGASYNQASSSLIYYRTSDGAPWGPDLTMPQEKNVPQWIYLYLDRNGKSVPWPFQPPFGPTNWNRYMEKKSWGFAWNLMAGFSYDIQDNLKLDIGYRYLNAGTYTSLPGYGVMRPPVTGNITAQEVRVGLRVTAY
jgi:opacity protein-like surface antigen